jgi:hypothetical protein
MAIGLVSKKYDQTPKAAHLGSQKNIFHGFCDRKVSYLSLTDMIFLKVSKFQTQNFKKKKLNLTLNLKLKIK